MSLQLKHPLYLASASPRRHELLSQIGVEHEIMYVPAPEGEDEPVLAHESALAYVQRTALNKLEQALQWRSEQPELHQNSAILCADTTVELEGEILAKPRDLAHAAEMLKALSGQHHSVHTAACLAYAGQIYQAVSSSQVWFMAMSQAEIAAYCHTQEPLGKAGAYGIQGAAAAFIKRLEGSYSSVMGLDLYQTYELLLKAKLLKNIAPHL